MEEKVVSFRADPETERKLIELVRKEQERCKEEGNVPKARSELIRDALNYYYQFQISGENNDLYVYRISLAMRDAMHPIWTQLIRALNSLQYRSMITQELVRIVCSAIEFNGSEKGLVSVLEKENKWDLCAQKIVTEDLRKMEELDEYEGNGSNY